MYGDVSRYIHLHGHFPVLSSYIAEVIYMEYTSRGNALHVGRLSMEISSNIYTFQVCLDNGSRKGGLLELIAAHIR